MSCAADYVEKANAAAEAATQVGNTYPDTKNAQVLELLAWAQFNMLRAIEQRLLVIEDHFAAQAEPVILPETHLGEGWR